MVSTSALGVPSLPRPVIEFHRPPAHNQPAEPSDGRGLAVLCLDGLSFPAMQAAVKDGLMPNLRYLLQVQHHVARCFIAGTPCTTPASLAGFAYGFNDRIPGFVWYDKSTGHSYSASSYHDFHAGFEAGAQAGGGPGLYSRGSVQSAIVAGGSHDTHMVLDTMSEDYQRGGRRAVARGLVPEFAELLRHPIQAVKTWTAFPREILRAVRDDATDASGITLPWKDVAYYAVAKRGVENVLMTDVAVQRMKDEMKHGVPVMFADLAGYDVASHRHGPSSPQAMGTLRRIDEKVGEVYRESIRKNHRQYEMVILSDHGQTPGLEWQRRFGAPFQSYLDGLVHPVDPAERIVTAPTGSLDHIYFTSDRKQWQYRDVEAKYPGLIAKLAAHPGIDFVVTRDRGASVIVGKSGRIEVKNGKFVVYGRDPLAGRGDTTELASQIAHVALMPNAGDLIVFGAWDGKQVVTFVEGQDQLGGHGGLGGDQDRALIVTEAGRQVDTRDVHNAEQMYPILRGFLPADAVPAPVRHPVLGAGAALLPAALPGHPAAGSSAPAAALPGHPAAGASAPGHSPAGKTSPASAPPGHPTTGAASAIDPQMGAHRGKNSWPVEMWIFKGNLESDGAGPHRQFSLGENFWHVRPVIAGHKTIPTLAHHSALSDYQTGEYLAQEQTSLPLPLLSKLGTDRLDFKVTYGGWGDLHHLRTFFEHLRQIGQHARAQRTASGVTLDTPLQHGGHVHLDLTPATPPMWWKIQMGHGGQSDLMAYPMMDAHGEITTDGATTKVHGEMYAEQILGAQDLLKAYQNLTWFYFDVDPDTRAIVYDFTDQDGNHVAPQVKLCHRDGRLEEYSHLQVTPLTTWTSPDTGKTYGTGYRVEIPDRKLTVEIHARMDAQEVPGLLGLKPFYYGGVNAHGEIDGRPFSGPGYTMQQNNDSNLF